MRDLPQPPKVLQGGGLPGKLIVVEAVYHQREGQQTVQVADGRYTRWLVSSLAPYVDEFTATDEWQQVQTGRIKEVGQVIVENLEGTDLVQVPTEQERQEIASRVLEVGLVPVGVKDLVKDLVKDDRGEIIVPTGESCRFQPAPYARLALRCRTTGQQAKCKVTVLPA